MEHVRVKIYIVVRKRGAAEAGQQGSKKFETRRENGRKGTGMGGWDGSETLEGERRKKRE